MQIYCIVRVFLCINKKRNMETLHLPKSVLLKEIIRYGEDMYILNAEAAFCSGWEFRVTPVHIRADVKALAEILRLENPAQTRKIEDILLNMLGFGEPPRIDIQELTGDFLLLRNCELVVRTTSEKMISENLHDLPQIVDVFAKPQIESLEHFLTIEKEFSKEILEKTFNDFQKMFFLMERGYHVDAASAMTQTNNPISAMIYEKIKQQLDPEEVIFSVAQSREEILEENYSFQEFVDSKNDAVPF
jgi:hypothetical protein